MRGGDARAELPRDLERLVAVEVADPLQERGEVLAVDVLHAQEVLAFDLVDVVDAADVRVRDLPREADLGVEAREEPGVGGDRLREELQGDGLAELQVVGAVDLAHPAAAEEADDPVAPADHRSRREGAEVDRVRGREAAGRRRRLGRQPASGPCPISVGRRESEPDEPDTESPQDGQNRPDSGSSALHREQSVTSVEMLSQWTRRSLRGARRRGAGRAGRCAILRRSGRNAGNALWRRRSGSRSGLKRRSIANGPRRQPSERQTRHSQALSSVVEHYLDTVGVSSSILLAPTIRSLSRAAAVWQLEGA